MVHGAPQTIGLQKSAIFQSSKGRITANQAFSILDFPTDVIQATVCDGADDRMSIFRM
jgi:hypothetical protein